MSANSSSPRSPLLVAATAIVLAGVAIGGGACQDDPRAASATKPASAPPAAQGDQSFDEAMRVVCDAPDQADLPPGPAGEANRAMVLAVWIDKRVRNQEVRQLLGGKSASTPERKIQALESGARRAGITRCALADLWQAGAESRPENKP
jgi:hypothetical protein